MDNNISPTIKSQKKSENKSKLLFPVIVIVLIVFFLCFCCCISSTLLGNSSNTGNTTSDKKIKQDSNEVKKDDETITEEKKEEEKVEEKKEPKIGEAVRDGKFEFTVNNIECGVPRVGDEYFGEDASGEFCIVNIKVENIGNQSQYFSSSSQYLIDSENRKLSASSSATFSHNTNAWLKEINPGVSITGDVVFDVAKNAKISKIELHDSMFSGGIIVTF